jgi:hypothetical protein
MAPVDLLAPPAADEHEDYADLRRYLAGEVSLPGFLDEAAVESLVDALVRSGNADRLSQLAASRDKAVAKPARRGIHLLRTRGVNAQVAPVPPAATRTSTEVEPETASLITAPLRDGEYLVWYTFSTPSGRVQICQASVTELGGLVRFEVYRTSRKQWRSIEKSIEAESKLPVTRVPTPYARWLIEEGYQRSLAVGRTPPREYAESRALLEPPVAVDRHPGLDVSGEAEVRAIADPERALELPEARSWIPDEASVRATLTEIDKLADSPLILDEGQQAERRQEVIHHAAAQALQGGLRARLSRRLLDTAYFITRASLDGPRGARDYGADAALAVAGALHMEDPSIAPEDNRIGGRLYARIFDQIKPAARPAPEDPPQGGGVLINP